MEISIAAQTMSFFMACLLGAGLGLLYDLFRILRMLFVHPAMVVAVQDILYFLISAGVTFGYLLTMVDGQIRWFVLAGEGIGWVLYYCTVGDLVLQTAHSIIKWLSGILRWILRPFVWIGKKIIRWGNHLQGKAKSRMKKIVLNEKMRLKRRQLLLYNLIKIPGKKARIAKGGDNR